MYSDVNSLDSLSKTNIKNVICVTSSRCNESPLLCFGAHLAPPPPYLWTSHISMTGSAFKLCVHTLSVSLLFFIYLFIVIFFIIIFVYGGGGGEGGGVYSRQAFRNIKILK